MELSIPLDADADENFINETFPFHLEGRYNYTMSELIHHRTTEAIIGLLTIFSAFTNAVVIYVMLSKKFGKRTTIKYLYANISLSDQMFIFSCLINVTVHGPSKCTFECRRFVGLTVLMSGFVSAYTMALIAFKRYYGIAFPLKELTQNRKTLPYFIAIILIWLCSISATLYFTNFEAIPEYDETILLQVCTLLSNSFLALRDHPYYILVGIVTVPLTFGLVFSLMTIAILQRRKLIGDHVDIAQQMKERHEKLKATFMIAVVIVSFIISWLPSVLLNLKYVLSYSKIKFCDFNYNAYAIVTTTLTLSFWINPVIYWYMSPHFRRGIKQMFFKRKTSNNANIVQRSLNDFSEVQI